MTNEFFDWRNAACVCTTEEWKDNYNPIKTKSCERCLFFKRESNRCLSHKKGRSNPIEDRHLTTAAKNCEYFTTTWSK